MNTSPLLLSLALLSLAACEGVQGVSGRATGQAPPAETELQGFDLFGADELLILERARGADRSGFSLVPATDALAFGLPMLGADRDERRAKGRQSLEDVAQESLPGGGGMVTHIEERTVVVPLEHTDVQGLVQGDVAAVRVRQTFQNPFETPIEAVYVFPLPHDAAVHDFLMKIGGRTIRGIVRERAEAERIYAAARAQGYTASLLTQERPNVFTQKVANIAPGAAIDVEIAYFHEVPLLDGEYELVFPMVVGPRFNPPGSTDGIGAVTLASAGSSGQSTEVPYLRPEERSGHDVSLAFELEAGAALEALACTTHAIETEERGPGRARVRLAARDTLPNKDFVLRWRVAGADVKAGLVTQRAGAGDGGWFTLTLHPPAELASLPREPLEAVFVVDCSGSMSGEPLALCKRALRHALKSLEADDTYRIIRFSNGSSQLADAPERVTAKGLALGLRYVDSLTANGGTMMMRGIEAALAHEADPGRQRVVTFMTDGYIGNEDEVLAAVRRHMGATRIFSFGVGSAPNRFLLEAMAREGRGACAYFGTNDDPTEVMDRFFGRLAHPALTHVELDWGGLRVSEVYPLEVPDLFVGRPVTLTGRYAGSEERASVVARGRVGGAWREILATVAPSRAADGALPKVWARTKIADLSSRARVAEGVQREELEQDILGVALEYGLASAFTAFVAVDSMTRVEGEATTVPVPVPVPEGVEFATTVSGS